MTAAYLMAQTLGDPHYIPSVAPNLTYTEQFKPTSIASGILSKPLNITSHRSFYDDVLCTAFTQYLVLDPVHPYVVDEINGVVVIYLGFPGLDRADPNPTPDSHMFRVEKGKIRYIHTLRHVPTFKAEASGKVDLKLSSQ
ncbi:hypothetical protein N0V90_008844 [Kalmusia sp. IMI 367209]|nr:hypothetical protein N0V90_008844 [Kalmusia sp. IMI 367209]